MSSFLKRRKSEHVEPDDSENGTSSYRNNSSSTSICDLPVFVSEGNDSVSPSTSQSSPFLPRRMPQGIHRKRSYSRTDVPLLPTLFKATLKHASRGFIIFFSMHQHLPLRRGDTVCEGDSHYQDAEISAMAQISRKPCVKASCNSSRERAINDGRGKFTC